MLKNLGAILTPTAVAAAPAGAAASSSGAKSKQAKSLGTDGATLAQAWAYSRHYMAAVIIGATSLAQLEANWAAASFELSEETLKKVDEIHMRHRNPNFFD